MSDPTVLVVEDEPDIAALYSGFLEERYDVTVAETATEAVDRVDAAVDVVLLDRRLPDGSGDDVLEHIRESGYDCRVAMVTAVEPDFDIIDMGFDLYSPSRSAAGSCSPRSTRSSPAASTTTSFRRRRRSRASAPCSTRRSPLPSARGTTPTPN